MWPKRLDLNNRPAISENWALRATLGVIPVRLQAVTAPRQHVSVAVVDAGLLRQQCTGAKELRFQDRRGIQYVIELYAHFDEKKERLPRRRPLSLDYPLLRFRWRN